MVSLPLEVAMDPYWRSRSYVIEPLRERRKVSNKVFSRLSHASGCCGYCRSRGKKDGLCCSIEMLMSRREGIDLVCQVVLMYLRVKHFGRFIAVRWLAEKAMDLESARTGASDSLPPGNNMI
ncbi:hypothetical protein ISN45_At01g035960 [Arabidopsis thaliana x Arabidopsis arenosa]|uniref:Uncharacterized protein n=1 Tax=Arabidopsis thaliana x Arabidopsis arenosa TaxID=1240361 RepID=A0A8T2GMT2_9BRAS|nr:hypothetical protein ISN45_At01g035960 [Arabidopsis thaliana x Arabidopsis arenosa]